MKKGDDEDDEVRTTAKPQVDVATKWELKNLLTELNIYNQIWPSESSHRVGGEGGREQEIDGHCRNSDPQLDIHTW